MEESNPVKSARKNFGRLGWSLAAVGSILLLNSLFYALLMIGDELRVASGQDSVLYLYEPSTFVYWLLFRLPIYAIGYPAAVLILKKLPRTPVEKVRFSAKRLTGFVLAAMALVLPVSIVTTLLIDLIHQDVNLPILTKAPGVSFWTLLDLLVFAPVFEELLFRRVLLDRFRRYGEGLAILVSSGCFSLMHMNLQQATIAFVLGALLAYVYLRSGNLWYCVFLHSATNFFGTGMMGILMNRLSPKAWLMLQTQNQELLSPEVASELVPMMGYMLLISLLFIAGWIILIRNRKKIQLLPTAEKLAPKQAAKAMLGSAGMLLYLANTLFVILTNITAPLYQI